MPHYLSAKVWLWKFEERVTVMVVVLVFEEEVVRVILANGPQARSDCETVQLFMKWHASGVYKILVKWFLGCGILTNMLEDGWLRV